VITYLSSTLVGIRFVSSSGAIAQQRTLALAAGFEKHRKMTRRVEFLSEMTVVVPRPT
jgi:hypothetical protein